MSLLCMRNICKSFNGIPVLKQVELTIEKGEVHALLGENGAGKSTLMNILAGVFPADSGEMEFDEKKIKKMTIQQSEKMGIAFVHQELNLFNDLKVYENIFLMKEYKRKAGALDKKRMIRETQQLFTELGVEINPEEKVENLKTSQKQLLEISKALFFKAKLLILDEPTTSLNNDEVEHLFQIIRNLKDKGTSFIFISHKMPEIFQIADRYTVLRNGEFVQAGKISEITQEEMTDLMVGEKLSHQEIYQAREPGENILELDHLSGYGFSDVNFTVKKGSIVGLTGLQGSGSSELLQGLFGAVPVTGGTLKLHGKDCKIRSIQGAMKAGIAMLASNRKENSVIPDMSILENMYLSEQVLSARHPFISIGKERKRYERYKEMLSVKAEDPDDPITSLSGGNQQKVFLARWLNTEADILLLDNPTQGIDVGAKAEIYKLILKLADTGKTILINTLEIPELAKVADYCAVFYEGTVIKVLKHEEIDEKTVMLYSTNAAQKGE
ncbi:sugar ABC transporter ATP-binding protein [Ruminococcus sp. AF37-6AT]|jgi:ribose transport system ATP-binding protein|nr:sugar ABC transporter ATP-binding protein [Ruminococcus sp. AM22-13]RHL46921.1 sugar ABC transporter ATP-binding protein [Ruminococcus sp. AF37-6AT]RHP55382.1 sugar ABC transporter ATP-binding protein [Ruminococcus sp. AF31-16BH]